MIPKGAEGIAHLGTRIMADLIPKASDSYTIADLAMTASLIDMIGQDYDRAVDVLVSDDFEMRPIIEDGARHLGDGPLKQRIVAALASRPASLRVHELSAHADAMLKVLVDLHDAIEQADSQGAPWAFALNLRMWAFLDAYVQKRVYRAGI
jgi:hypothetical protein